MAYGVLAAGVVGGKVTPLTEEQAAARIKEPAETIWVHATVAPNTDVPTWLRESLGKCPLTMHDWSYSHTRAGVEQRNGTLAFLCVIPKPAEEVEYLHMGVFVAPNRIITVSRHDCRSIRELFDSWLDDPEDMGTDVAGVLHGILDSVVDDHFPVLDALHARAEVLEDKVYEIGRLDPTAPLALKREFLTLRKQISPLRDTLNGLIRFGPPLIPSARLPEFNDVLNHALRISENADLGRDIVSSIMDAQLGVVSARLNEVMRTLTVLSTLLMVCSLISGIYGMNFKYMPELEWQYGYPFAIMLMVVACVIVVLLFKRRKWL